MPWKSSNSRQKKGKKEALLLHESSVPWRNSNGWGGGGGKKSTPVARILCALEQLKFKAKSTDNNLLLHECS